MVTSTKIPVDETRTPPNPNLPTTLPLPVDRDWISKLLRKYPTPNARRDDKALVVAPMVDQSDLPFRLLSKHYGANLCFTPMIHTRLLLESDTYREKFVGTWLQQDRPLIAQLCGSDPDVVLQAARMVEPYVDGIDINCGCPQTIAKRGNYGAFLLEQEDKLLTLVKHMLQHIRVPLSVKVRLVPSVNHPDDKEWDIPKESLKLYSKLVDLGIHLLTIHGRTRYAKGVLTGKSDWETIRKAIDLFGSRIPIFANGSIESYDDVEECLKVTNADGVMSSESVLEFPPIFYKIPQNQRTISRMQIAQEYLDLAKRFPPNVGGQGSGMKCIRTHIHKILNHDLQRSPEVRRRLVDAETFEQLQSEVDQLDREYYSKPDYDVATEELSWYHRHRYNQERHDNKLKMRIAEEKKDPDAEAAAECACSFFGEDVDASDY